WNGWRVTVMAKRDSSDEPRPEDNGRPMSALDRQIQQALGEGKVLGNDDDPAREKLPALWDWLSRGYVGPGHVKQPAHVTIRLAQGGVMATVTDRDLCVSVDVATPYLTDILAAMDRALANPSTPLRTWGKKEPNLRKRKQ